MKLSLAIIAAMTSVVSADYWYRLHFETCQGHVNPDRLEISIYPGKMVDIGLILQRFACQVRLVSTSPGINPANVGCMTYKDPHDGSTTLFETGQSMNGGKTLVSKPFRGIYCYGG
ncbi:hypothetical protein ACJQWK_07785 [Exserohilum turcicum]|uniref:Uncharacterized protein n=1 Tax=Exserohilum turcicum (strain 28A) TaxID=671987 RepID=R0IL00_EXST2|nr:uncharacterized protein SETTUDRAFT_161801 [Exserohilum turcica Et28A]EOA85740.1 hypothetical protein SETTUDRAFT_161801 [Exserohilum turcica Et28A]